YPASLQYGKAKWNCTLLFRWAYSFRQAVHLADDGQRNIRSVEIDEDSELSVGQLQVGEELQVMDRGKVLDGFYLNDHFLLHENVNSIPDIELDLFVDQG